MLWTFLILSVVIGWIRGGTLRRFGGISLKTMWIFVLAFILQILLVLLGVNGTSIILNYIRPIYIVSYLLLFIGIVLNIKYRELIVILIGGLLNLFVFISNSGKIPVTVEGLRLAGLDNIANFVQAGKMSLYIPLSEGVKYGFLGQIITIGQPYPYPQVLSIGDVIIALGLFVFIQGVMLDRSYDGGKMVTFSFRK